MAGLSVVFKAVDEISARFEAMSSAGIRALDSFDRIETAADSAYSTISDSVDEAAESMNQATQATDYWTDAIENYDRGAEEAVNTTEGLVDIGYMTEEALNNAARAADEATDSLGEYGNETEEARRNSEEFGNSATGAVMSLNDILATAGIAIALKEIGEAFVECSVVAAEFETSIAKVSTVADTNVLSAEKLSEQISSLSKNMAENVNDLADSTYNAISAGINTANAVETVGTATKLSAAGFTDVTSSLSVLTTALNAYHMSATDLTNVSDSLVMSQNLGVMTIDQLSSSMGKAISTASAYSVDLYNLESGYISLTKSGISVDESTTYMSSMLSELGDSGSNVAKILNEETGKSFGQLMDSGYTLADALDIVYNSVDQNSEALMNLWGSAEAGKASNAIINQGLETFNSNLEKVKYSSGTTEKAYKTMISTNEFSTQRMTNSFDNLHREIGNNLNPLVKNLQDGVADITDEFTKFINKHPAVSAVLTGLTVGITTVVAGIAAYVAITKVASVVSAALGTTMSAALGPISLITASIAAASASLIYFSAKMEEADYVEDNLVTSSQKMETELNSLQDQYEETVEVYGRNSDEAYALKSQIDELSESFEENKITIGALSDEIESLGTAIEETYQTYEDAISFSGQLEYSSNALVTQLASLTTNAVHTEGELDVMQGIVDSLNSSYEGLNLTLDKTNGKINLSIEDLYSAVAQAADKANKQAATDALVGTLQTFDELKQKREEAMEESSVALQKYNTMEEQWKTSHPWKAALAGSAAVNWSSELTTAYNEYNRLNEEATNAGTAYDTNIDKIKEYCEQLGYSSDETEEFIKSLTVSGDTAEETAEKISDSVESTMSSSEAVTSAVSGVQDQIQELAQAYDDAYNSARESIDGQIGLFDTMKTNTELSISNMQEAMESQIEYLNTYTDNLQKASEYGLNEGLISSLSNGSAESAGELDAIISKIEDLGGTTEGMSEDAKKFVDSFNDSFSKVDEAKDSFANTVAEMETDFSDSMDAIENDLFTAIDNMNMADDAASAARATMDAYIKGIKDKTGEVNSALAAITWTNNTMMPSIPVTAHADGGIFDTPHYGVFAEEGPEAFIPIDGSQNAIDIWKDTGHMLGTYNEKSNDSSFYVAPTSAETDSNSSSEDKTVTVKIEGSGDMRIGSNLSKDDVVNLMIENMKGVLMNIINQEILEEGDLSYDF